MTAPITRVRIPVRVLALAHGGLIAGILVAAIGGFHAFNIEGRVIVAATTVVLVNSAALLLVNGANGRSGGLSRWRLGPWYLAWGTLAYGVASYAWTDNQVGPPSIIVRESVVAACYLYAVATAAWTVGYLTGFGNRETHRETKLMRFLMGKTAPKLKSGSAVPWGLYLAGVSARATLAALSGGLGYLADPSSKVSSAAAYSQILTALSSLATFGVALAAYQFFDRKRKGGGLPLTIMLAAEIATGLVLGSKEPFLVAILAVLIPYGMHRGRFPIKALSVTALSFLLIVLPFNQAYRSVLRDGGRVLTMSESIAVAPEVFKRVLSPESASGTFAESYDDTMYRVRLIDNVALVMQKTPSVIAYRSPSEYLYAPAVGFIPRVVWPSKPILVGGYEFSQQYYNFPPSIYSASAVTTLGDLFRHGGWLVVIIGSLILGAAVRTFDRVFDPSVDPRALFFVLAFFTTVVKSEMDSVELIIAIPTLIFTAMVGVRLIAVRHREESPQAQK